MHTKVLEPAMKPTINWRWVTKWTIIWLLIAFALFALYGLLTRAGILFRDAAIYSFNIL
jgi:hypothetical protein